MSFAADLLAVLLPTGGYVVTWTALFDESGTEDGSPLFCVAGYVFDKDQFGRLDSAWGAMLDDYKLPFFRMSSCAHGNGVFKYLSLEQRIAVQTQAIQLIKDHMTFGFSVGVDRKWEHVAVRSEGPFTTAYGFACFQCLQAIYHFANTQDYKGDVAYIFETGHASQADANNFMNNMFRFEVSRKTFRYASHTFADKRKIRPLQCADVLAWLFYTHFKKRMSGQAPPIRKDFAALMEKEKQHWGQLFLESNLRALEMAMKFPVWKPGLRNPEEEILPPGYAIYYPQSALPGLHFRNPKGEKV